MKKIYFLFLLALLPLVASADAVKIGSIYYNLNADAKTAEVTSNPNKYTGEVVIPKTVTYQSVKYKVTSIGGVAFFECSGLTSVTIPKSVKSIGWGAFYSCSGLTSVSIPNSVTSIGQFAFYNCSGLTSVAIPSSVTSIGWSAFEMYKSNSLTSVYITDLAAWCKISFEGRYSNPLYYAEHLFLNGTEIKDLVIPNSVTSIGDYAFTYCSGLTSVTIGNSVTSIGGYAFCCCRCLTSVTIPNSVTAIGEETFNGCIGLTSLTIPNSVTSIGNNAFQYCSGLTSITIPNSVTSIGDYAFSNCSGLSTIMIGNGINKISNYAFANCVKLSDVYCYAENVPGTDIDAFSDSYIEYATLHVPVSSVDAYKAAEPWSGFKSKMKITSKVKLSKTKATIEKTKTLTLKATVTPSDLLDKSVTWKSSNTKVATVSSKGKVTGVKAGTATITCTSKVSGAKATCAVTVGYVKLDQTEAVVKKGKTITLTPTVYPSSLADKSVTWTSSNTAVATVSSTGKVKGVKTGTVTITCTSKATGLSRTCEVLVANLTLNNYELSIQKGKTATLTATVYPSSLEDKSVTWESSNTKVATVSSSGKVKGIKAGTATITCTCTSTGLSRTCKVTVTATSGSRSVDGDNDDDDMTGIENLEEAPALTEPFDVYDLSGRKVLNQTTSLDGLPDGIYIVNGRKILKKK